VTNGGAGRVAYVSRDDCAAAAAAVITGGDHAGRTYDITGPELIGAEGRAAVFAELGGRQLEVVQVDDETFATGVAEATGLPVDVGRLFASFGAAARQGWLGVLSSDFAELTGRAPQDLKFVLEQQRVGAAA
jgi:NAD(P)H dehydrogenase (quinone)